MRITDEDIVFSRFVLNNGNGDLNDDDNNVSIPERCIIRKTNFINCTYLNLIRNHLYDEKRSSVILSPRNAHVNEINKMVVLLLDKKMRYKN